MATKRILEWELIVWGDWQNRVVTSMDWDGYTPSSGGVIACGDGDWWGLPGGYGYGVYHGDMEGDGNGDGSGSEFEWGS